MDRYENRSNPDVGTISLCKQYTWDTADQAILQPQTVNDLLRRQLDFFQSGLHRPDDPDSGILKITVTLGSTFDDTLRAVKAGVDTEYGDEASDRPVSVYIACNDGVVFPAFLLAVTLILRFHIIGRCVCVLLDPHCLGVPGTQYSLRNHFRLLMKDCEQVSVADIQRMYRNILGPIMAWQAKATMA